MAKKKDKIVINKEDLAKTTLGEIAQPKNNVPFILVIFILLIVAVVFSPYIKEWYENYMGENDTQSVPYVNNVVTDDDNDVTDTGISEKYKYESGLDIKTDAFSIEDIIITNNKISFNIVNNSKSTLDLTKDNYYLELYNDTLLTDTILIERGVYAGDFKKEYSKTIKGNDVTDIIFKKMNDDDYPSVSVIADEDGKSSFVCKNDTDALTYYAENSEIYGIDHIISLSSTDDGYMDNFQKYSTLVNGYNNLAGVKTNTELKSNGVVFTINIDLKQADLSKLSSSYYYAKGTTLNKINYDMSALGFSCK